MPYQSVLTEMTPDTDERTSITAHRSFWGKLATILGTWIWTITQLPLFNDPLTGAPDSLRGMRFVGLALGMLMILVSILPAFLIKERNPDFITPKPKELF